MRALECGKRKCAIVIVANGRFRAVVELGVHRERGWCARDDRRHSIRVVRDEALVDAAGHPAREALAAEWILRRLVVAAMRCTLCIEERAVPGLLAVPDLVAESALIGARALELACLFARAAEHGSEQQHPHVFQGSSEWIDAWHRRSLEADLVEVLCEHEDPAIT